MSRPPANRDELFQFIADAIGWGVTADAVAEVTVEIEAKGVRFIPVVPTPVMTQALIDGMHAGAAPAFADAIAANPYAPKPKPKP